MKTLILDMVIKKKSFYEGIKLMTNTACKIVVR